VAEEKKLPNSGLSEGADQAVTGAQTTVSSDTQVVPIIAEELSVSKEVVETGRVRLNLITHPHEELVYELFARESVEVEHVPIGRSVDTIPLIRQEGDTTIVPVVEEEVVVQRRLILKEEIHLRRVRTTKRHQERVTLRRQEAVVTRIPVEVPADEARPTPGPETEPTKSR
jgi:stress response protein YsnF